MIKYLFSIIFACLSVSINASNDNFVEASNSIASNAATTSFDIGPVMCTSSPNSINEVYSFYVPVLKGDINSLRFEWRVDSNNMQLNYQYNNYAGIKFTQAGWYLVWVDVYDKQGNKLSASMTVSVD